MFGTNTLKPCKHSYVILLWSTKQTEPEHQVKRDYLKNLIAASNIHNNTIVLTELQSSSKYNLYITAYAWTPPSPPPFLPLKMWNKIKINDKLWKPKRVLFRGNEPFMIWYQCTFATENIGFISSDLIFTTNMLNKYRFYPAFFFKM